MGFHIGHVRSRVARMGRRVCAGITCMGLNIAAYGAWRCICGRIDIVVPTVEFLCLDVNSVERGVRNFIGLFSHSLTDPRASFQDPSLTRGS